MLDKPNPLKIPEIIRLVGSFLESSSEIAAMKVSKRLHAQISATAWETIVVDFMNKALYRDLPVNTDISEGETRLLPWKSLKSHGSHVRSITLVSVNNQYPPRSYPRPVSVTDLLTKIGELPYLRSMTLNIWDVNTVDLPQLFDICSRLKSLNIRRCHLSGQPNESTRDFSNRTWISQASSHKSTSDYDLEELSLSSNSGIGLWEFLSRSPRLRVLSIYDVRHVGHFEERIMKELVKSFQTEGSMPSLQHLDLCIYKIDSDAISNVLKSVRCLRRFKCLRKDASLSIPDFRRHFSTLTTIDVQSGKPEFWQEVMSSCRGLVKAKEVVLFAEDIIGEKIWASTQLESLELGVLVTSKGDVRSRSKESALFRRIAKLVKLNRLSLHTGWLGERTLRDESWDALLGIETLKSVELGYSLTVPRDRENFLSIFSEKKVDLKWTVAKMSLSSEAEDHVNMIHDAILREFSQRRR